MTAKPSSTETPPQTTAEAKSRTATGSTSILGEHKGKLALGVAATLGLVIFYNWRQKKLPEEDPEAYARLQRIKEGVKAEAWNAKRPGQDKPPPAEVPASEP
jgi:uncharacterized protein HemX